MASKADVLVAIEPETEPKAKTQFKEGIRLAEEGHWNALVSKLKEDRSIAQHKDHYGMLPLHWACTEREISPDTLRQLLDAFPEAALTKNNAQMLPLHIAVRARAPAEILKILCTAHPSSIAIQTSYQKLPIEIATDVGIDDRAMSVLKSAEKEYSLNGGDHATCEAEFESAKRQSLRLSFAQRDGSIASSRASTINAESDACGVCSKSFNMFSKRHQCHNCGIVLCKLHVGGKVELPNYFSKKSVCGGCLEVYDPNASKQQPKQERQTAVIRRDSLKMPYGRKAAASIDAKSGSQSLLPPKTSVLLERIEELESTNSQLQDQMVEQESMYAEAMLLLTQTMTRVARLEMKCGLQTDDMFDDDDDDQEEFTPFDEDFSDLSPRTSSNK